jgi:Archaea bacterial proteins of unknown function
MAGTRSAVESGEQLVREVIALTQALGLVAHTQFKMGKRIWGAERRIDIIVTNPADGKRLGIECKYQGVQGSAEEKIPSTIQDIDAWPIKGIVVFAGDGLSANMRAFLIASGKASHLDDLRAYLQLFFGLPI